MLLVWAFAASRWASNAALCSSRVCRMRTSSSVLTSSAPLLLSSSSLPLEFATIKINIENRITTNKVAQVRHEKLRKDCIFR